MAASVTGEPLNILVPLQMSLRGSDVSLKVDRTSIYGLKKLIYVNLFLFLVVVMDLLFRKQIIICCAETCI
jgi:hypothetical protein